MTILFLLLVVLVVVCVVLAANGKLYKLADDLRKTIDNATDQRVKQRRETSRRPTPFIASSTTPLRAATTVPARPTFTASPK